MRPTHGAKYKDKHPRDLSSRNTRKCDADRSEEHYRRDCTPECSCVNILLGQHLCHKPMIVRGVESERTQKQTYDRERCRIEYYGNQLVAICAKHPRGKRNERDEKQKEKIEPCERVVVAFDIVKRG